MNVLELPIELISHCLSFLKGYDLARLSQTCKAFNEITEIELTWQKTCSREYRLSSNKDWNLSFREVYGKVLHKYGYLLGLWRDKSSCYGGLIHVWYGEGCIRAMEYYPTKDVREGLLKKEIFKISLSDNKEIDMRWNPGFCQSQPCDIENETGNNTDHKIAVVKKRWADDYKPDIDQEQKEMEEFLQECSVRGTHPELCMYKWQTHKNLKLSQTIETFHISNTCPEGGLLPRPGLYKGLYGGHGTELVLLSYDLENKKALTRKISGDPNVPAGEISITADLSKPLVLTKEQQESIKSLKEVEVWAGPAVDSNQSVPRKQPFWIPREVASEDEFSLPKYCVSRYMSQGTVSPMGYRNPQQIVNHFIVFDESMFVVLWYKGTATVSPMGYRNPQQIPAHFVVFDENMFGGLWMDLYSFGTFVRIQEQFL